MLYYLAAAKSIHRRCETFTVPLHINATGYTLSNVPRFTNGYEAQAFLLELTGRDAPADFSSYLGQTRQVEVDVTVSARYCTPDKGGNEIMHLLSHGLGEDRSYWDFNRDYSYVNHALEKGYSTLAYDRIGNGRSSRHDPFDVLQAPVELAVLQELTRKLRGGKLHRRVPRPAKVVHVGNSFGSAISNALVATTPELSDGIVLGGYTHNGNYLSGFTLAAGFHLARETNPERLKHLSPGYLTWPDKYALQYAYYFWPNFEPRIITKADDTKSSFTMGEFLTIATLPLQADHFPGPVLNDRLFCGGNCTGILDGPDSISESLFPASSTFETYIHPSTGHEMALHLNASGWQDVAFDFIKEHVI
ncbi:hypothetical protein B0I35DRAFT_364813 [Stachybotrys elegans]|uniref:AB hydrolase-1 domain-containing protein n=1 Tax=Stachybotrys elegans TaxID=80388 RepID=A0A8K0SBT5_9HYPO|nr:hypothetical protein B0I35DRAFT_364813 [Stachybotrys elegans]